MHIMKISPKVHDIGLTIQVIATTTTNANLPQLWPCDRTTLTVLPTLQVVQREPAMSEPGKHSTHLVGVKTAGRESWHPRCADHGDSSKNGRQRTWPRCHCRQSLDMMTRQCCVSSGLLPTSAVASVNMLADVWFHYVASPGDHLNTPGLLQLATQRDQRQPVPTSRSKCCSTPHHQHKKVQACQAHPAAATLASSPPTCAIQDCRASVQGLHDLLSVYLAVDCQIVSVTGRRQMCSSDINTCLAQQTNTHLGDHSFAAAGPRVWNSLPTQLWESDITLGQFRRALKTHLFGHWQLQRRVTCFSCTVYKFACLLTSEN